MKQSKSKHILICKRIRFFCIKDEEAFFEWIKKIDCINKISATSRELYLHIQSKAISDQNLDDIIGLFYRYNVNMKQLKQFLTEKIKSGFITIKRLFGIAKYLENKTIMKDYYLTCKQVCFYSALDEGIFFAWIKKIDCIKSFEAAGDELYLDLKSKTLDYNDIKDIIALFYRYKIDMKQLASFVNDKNMDAIKPWKKKILT